MSSRTQALVQSVHPPNHPCRNAPAAAAVVRHSLAVLWLACWPLPDACGCTGVACGGGGGGGVNFAKEIFRCTSRRDGRSCGRPTPATRPPHHIRDAVNRRPSRPPQPTAAGAWGCCGWVAHTKGTGRSALADEGGRRRIKAWGWPPDEPMHPPTPHEAEARPNCGRSSSDVDASHALALGFGLDGRAMRRGFEAHDPIPTTKQKRQGQILDQPTGASSASLWVGTSTDAAAFKHVLASWKPPQP